MAEVEQETSERIGWLHPRPFGYRIECAAKDCGWYLDYNKRDGRAGDVLRSHAALMHAQPIPVLREKPSPA